MAQQEEFPKPRFVVFGVEKTAAAGPGKPGDEVRIDETLHKDSPNGDEVGFADGSFKVNPGGRDATGEVTLHFTDPPPSTVKAGGTLSWNPGGKFGVGTLVIKGGMTGKLHVTVVNPKRYSHEP